ncbi:MAG TPA: trypsin-like peptidase domain-containing protein [Phycisphaerales bacterium]|nr:trypsin-like peptidase domain-containing protein [Phycisphaerales bacterium]HMP35868.1 trypsin-like peptidase domain-containing protein [Phycisphaerales bacterium]
MSDGAARPRRAALDTYGPTVLVAAVAAAVLLLGPSVVRRLADERTDARVRHAAARLGEGSVLEAFNAAAADVARMVEPSVVHVSTAATMTDAGSGRSVMMTSSGSGWIFDREGHIVSNAHVIDGAERIDVQLHNGVLRRATVVGLDLATDIAVLRIEADRLVPATRGRSESVRQGDMVFAFGSPFEFRFSMSSGIVSGLGRSAGLTDVDFENFIQVDAAINPGNSGGPLTDIRGHVVGMNTAIATNRGSTTGTQGQFAGIGLAIPMAMIESVVAQLIAKGEVDRGFMGVRVGEIDDTMARLLQFEGRGVVVRQVESGGPAERAGLRTRDVITHVDEQPISLTTQIPAMVASRQPGDSIRLRIWRGGSGEAPGGSADLDIVLDKLDPALLAERPSRALRRFGVLELVTASGLRAASIGAAVQRGVLVTAVEPGSHAARTLPTGSVIVAVNDQPVATVDQLYARLARIAGPRSVPRMVPRVVTVTAVAPDGQRLSVTVPM